MSSHPPLPPDDDAELEAAQAELDPGASEELRGALRAAWAPTDLDATRHEQLLALALGAEPLEDGDEPEAATEDATGSEHAPHAALAAALRAAYAPTELDDARHHELLERALAQAPAPARSNVVYVAFGVLAAGLAIAASVVLVFGSAWREPRREAPSLVTARSTEPLFREKFELGGTSERLDRIAAARARDLRSNRYATWGVR